MSIRYIFGIHDGGFVLLGCVFLGFGIYGIKSGQTWGKAVRGGSNQVLRAENPGSFWFLISLHILIGTLMMIYGLFGLSPHDLLREFMGG